MRAGPRSRGPRMIRSFRGGFRGGCLCRLGGLKIELVSHKSVIHASAEIMKSNYGVHQTYWIGCYLRSMVASIPREQCIAVI